MTSALSIRLAERQAVLDAHNGRADLIRFVDGPPVVEVTSAYVRDGQLVSPSQTHIVTQLIPEGNLRLVCISGVGDSIWTRGVLRETLKAGLKVWIDTPFEWAFWDMVGTPGFNFWSREQPASYGLRTATYLGANMAHDTVYGAMSKHCKTPPGDFSLPIHPEWDQAADAVLAQLKPKKPLMLYRPLLRNHGRRSVSSRNPDPQAYSVIYQAIRERFHVISVASSSGEDIVHADEGDTVFHRGELALTTVIALMKRALVYTNPGMALVAAAAVGAPVIGVFGGYEPAQNYEDTVVYGPSLLIDPIKPCKCMSDLCDTDKTVDLIKAVPAARKFCEDHCNVF